MALSKAAFTFSVNLVLDHQNKFSSTFVGTRNKRSELKEVFEKFGSEMAVTKYGNEILQKRITNME